MKFPILAFICLGLFAIASIFQLVFAFQENEKARRIDKPLCLLFLGLFAIFAFPNKPLIYIGAFLGMLGDILDLEIKTFILGVVCFYVGHLCYIFEVLYDLLGFNISTGGIVAIIATNLSVFVAMFVACLKFSKHSKVDSFGQSMYFAILVTYIPVFILGIIGFGKYIFLCLIGSIFFISSDSLLVKTHFGKKFKRYHFYIMGTYLFAEVLIVLGFILSFIY